MQKMNCRIGAIWTSKYSTPFIELPTANATGDITKMLFSRDYSQVHLIDGEKYLHYERVVYGDEQPLIKRECVYHP